MELLRVKEICKAKNLKMEDLANLLGITRATLTRNIAGNPTVETLERIASALGTPLKDLFTAPNSKLYGVVVYQDKPYNINSLEDLNRLCELIQQENAKI